MNQREIKLRDELNSNITLLEKALDTFINTL